LFNISINKTNKHAIKIAFFSSTDTTTLIPALEGTERIREVQRGSERIREDQRGTERIREDQR
jgi:hypothetical protein